MKMGPHKVRPVHGFPSTDKSPCADMVAWADMEPEAVFL